MAISSIPFLLCLLLLTAFFFLIPNVGSRRLLLSFCNIAFLGLAIPNVASLYVLIAFLGSGYLIARLGAIYKSRWILGVYFVILISVFAIVQNYSLFSYLGGDALKASGVAVLGLSYMLFRQIHFLVDCVQSQVPNVKLWTYINYQINFLALVAGPIQRYQDFAIYWANPTPILHTNNEILRAYLRIFIGVICVAGISSTLFDVHSGLQQELSSIGKSSAPNSVLLTALKLVAYIYVYPLYLYFNFAGYCDIVIGGAALIGLRLPENFSHVHLSRNILDFWTRWHKSLGLWVRDYLFTPMYMSLVRWNAKAAGSLAFACYFFAFVIMGIWHGTGTGFFIFGLMHGLGGSLTKLWEMYLLKRSGRKGLKHYLSINWIRRVAIFLTLNYFAVSLLFFSSNSDRFNVVWRTFTTLFNMS
jgi:alginate O-acetyltransferase complex protein AlgI